MYKHSVESPNERKFNLGIGGYYIVALNLIIFCPNKAYLKGRKKELSLL